MKQKPSLHQTLIFVVDNVNVSDMRYTSVTDRNSDIVLGIRGLNNEEKKRNVFKSSQ